MKRLEWIWNELAPPFCAVLMIGISLLVGYSVGGIFGFGQTGSYSMSFVFFLFLCFVLVVVSRENITAEIEK